MNFSTKNFINYKINGVIKIKNLFSKIEISLLKKKINLYIKNNKSKLKGKDINFINNQVNSIHLFNDNFFRIFSNQKKIIDLSRFFLKEEPKVRNIEYFAKPKKIGLASPMHQDNYYWNLKKPNAFTIWIAIDSANRHNGSIEYLVGSHKKMFSHIASYAPGSSQKIKNIAMLKKKFRKKTFKLNPGDCLLHHSQIIHGSKKNISDYSRRGFTIQIMSKNSKVDVKKFNNYQESLKKQISLRNNMN
jgi:phytanoyl-CoA hydroxylase